MKLAGKVSRTWAIPLLIFGSVLVCSCHRHNYPKVTLSNFDAESYKQFIDSLRSKIPVKKDKVYFMPVLREASSLTDQERFILVELGKPGRTVTLALDVSNLYVVAFGVGADSYFFTDGDAPAKNNLFDYQNSRSQHDLGEGNYVDIERVARGRDSINLGMQQLDDAVQKLAKNPGGGSGGKTQERAEALLIIIQMVAEAARLKYFRREVVRRDPAPPSTAMLSYVHNWQALSSKIQNANKDGTFDSPVQLKENDGKVSKESRLSTKLCTDIYFLLAKGTRNPPDAAK